MRMDTRDVFLSRVLQNPASLEFTEIHVIYAAQLIVSAGIRHRCQYSCALAHQSTFSPPITASSEDTRKMLDEYRYGLMVRREVPLSDEDVSKAWGSFAEKVLEFEHECFVRGYPKAFVPAIGTCLFGHLDETLRPCEYDGKSRPTFEAIGINLGESLEMINWENYLIRDAHDPFHMFAALMLE